MALRIVRIFRTDNIYFSCRQRYFHTSANRMKIVQFLLSDIGEGIKEVTVRDWFIKVGDRVRQFDDVCLVESDKAAVNITSRYDGLVTKIYHVNGAVAQVGKPLIDIDTEDSVGETGGHPANATQKTETRSAAASDSGLKMAHNISTSEMPVLANERQSSEESGKSLTTPAVRRILKEHRIALSEVNGSGKRGRIMKEDVLKYIESKSITRLDERPSGITAPPITNKSAPRSKEDRIVPIAGIRKAMAKTMVASHSIPSFGFSEELDVTRLVRLRDEIKPAGVTYMPFFMKALSKALEGSPELNAHTDEKCDNLIVKGEHNIGFAVDTAAGLLVPNIKNVERLSVFEISVELNRLISKAKDRTMSIHDMTGGTITISNIGIIGGTYVRPLINPPEVAIVGVGRFRKRPVFDENDAIVASITCNISWTADHRVIDGATLARFSHQWKILIENPLKLLLE